MALCRDFDLAYELTAVAHRSGHMGVLAIRDSTVVRAGTSATLVPPELDENLLHAAFAHEA
jgi:hypothetical protein